MELYFPLVLDGANGTELQKRGYDGSKCTEAWVLEHPGVMEQLQKEYIEAGSDIIYAPTFGANRVKLEANGIFNQVGDFNRRLVEISRRAAESASGAGRNAPVRTLIAGDIASTGKFLAPLGDVSFGELCDIYREQASALDEAGVDMFVIETVMTVPDARAALLAIRDVSDKPVLVSFTCDENGRTLTGTDVCAAIVIMQGMGADAFGLNCSTGPEEMLAQFARLGEFAEVPLAVKPNAGLPVIEDGRTIYSCTPEELAGYTDRFAEAGAALFGGCCGTGPEHIRALRDSLGSCRLRKPCPRHTDRNNVVCATEKDAFVLDMDSDGGIRADIVLACDADLEMNIRRENKSSSKVIAVRIEREADLDEFEAAQYAIRKPLCIVCDDTKLLEEALKLYQGRAVYAGDISTEELMPLTRRYGLII